MPWQIPREQVSFFSPDRWLLYLALQVYNWLTTAHSRVLRVGLESDLWKSCGKEPALILTKISDIKTPPPTEYPWQADHADGRLEHTPVWNRPRCPAVTVNL